MPTIQNTSAKAQSKTASILRAKGLPAAISFCYGKIYRYVGNMEAAIIHPAADNVNYPFRADNRPCILRSRRASCKTMSECGMRPRMVVTKYRILS